VLNSDHTRADINAGEILMAGLLDRLQGELDAPDQNNALSPIDLLDMPEALATVVNQVIRSNGMKLEDIAKEVGKSGLETRQMLDDLVEKGYLRQVELDAEIWYKVQFGHKADKVLSQRIWSALDRMADDEEQRASKEYLL
jgi:hypothetical protein